MRESKILKKAQHTHVEYCSKCKNSNNIKICDNCSHFYLRPKIMKSNFNK
jgi:hypothetical protein